MSPTCVATVVFMTISKKVATTPLERTASTMSEVSLADCVTVTGSSPDIVTDVVFTGWVKVSLMMRLPPGGLFRTIIL